jgi:hypothetical protein
LEEAGTVWSGEILSVLSPLDQRMKLMMPSAIQSARTTAPTMAMFLSVNIYPPDAQT